MPFSDVILAAGARTPFGDFGKSLKDVPLAALGVHAVKASLDRAGIDAAHVDHLVFGNTAPVDHDGLFVSRKIAINASNAAAPSPVAPVPFPVHSPAAPASTPTVSESVALLR